ncbi:MAG TPA: hypothetical protein PKH07_13925, partial [bacterium]|nr:hypothetical protein [bacterium]
LMKMIPGMSQMQQMQNVQFDDRELVTVEAIINSMTPNERSNPKIIGDSRRKRIAMGSGASPMDVTKLLKQFEKSRRQIKQMMSQMGVGIGGKLAQFGSKVTHVAGNVLRQKEKAKLKNRAKRKREKKRRK